MNVPIQLQFIFEDRLTCADDGSECTERQFSGSCLCDAGCEKGSSKKYRLAKHTSAFRHSSGGFCKLAQFEKSAPTIRSWRSRRECRTSVCAASISAKSRHLKLWLLAQGETDPRKLTYAEKCYLKSAFFGRGQQMNDDPEQQTTDVEDGRFAKWSLAPPGKYYLVHMFQMQANTESRRSRAKSVYKINL